MFLRRYRIDGSSASLRFDPDLARYYTDVVDHPGTAAFPHSLDSVKAYNDLLYGLATGQTAAALSAKIAALNGKIADTANEAGAPLGIANQVKVKALGTLLNGAYESESHEGFKLALHILAHECAHVEVIQRVDTAFPNILLRKAANMHEHARREIIKACWDEFAVTWICAPFGEDPTAGYEETFIRVLNETRRKANRLIRAYRLHENVEQIVVEIYGTYGDLMKCACYYLGNIAGRGLSLDDLPNTKAALEGHCLSVISSN
jgi:hypothetical protein